MCVGPMPEGVHPIYDRAKPRRTIYQNTLTCLQFYLLQFPYVLDSNLEWAYTNKNAVKF